MKHLKQTIACLFALLLAVSVLASCKEPAPGPESKPSDEGSISSSLPEETGEHAEKIDFVGRLKLDEDSDTKKQSVTVKQFVDGDTTHFNVPEDVDDSGVLKARYIGINTPESTGVIEKWGKQASNFTKEKLSGASSVIVESDDENWNYDNTTSHRCLLWVWYRNDEQSDYRNLNLELLQEGYAIANSSANNRYGSYCMDAIAQAKELGLHVYSSEKDPLFYEGSIKEVTLKALRTTPESYVGVNVAFDAVITREYNNTLYVQEYDEEDGIYYGMNVYYGFSLDPDCLAFMSIGNRVRFVGSLQFYEAGGTYQISGIKYNRRKPEESCRLVEKGDSPDYVEIDPKTFADGKKSVIITLRSEDDETMELEKEFGYAELVMSTALSMKNLKVESIYTTKNDSSSSKGAMTLTCKAEDGTAIDVRTVVLHDENGALITESYYAGKTIDVRGVVDYYEGSYQIKVFRPADITVH